MSRLESIYYKLPSFLQSLAVGLKARKNNRLRYGPVYEEYLSTYMRHRSAAATTLQSYQISQYKLLLSEAIAYSHYYGCWPLTEAQISSIVQVSDVISLHQELPYLIKDDLKQQLHDIENKAPHRSRDAVNFTSGTTGTPTESFYDQDSLHRSFALLRRFYSWVGLDLDSFTSVRLSGRLVVDPKATRPPYWVHNKVDSQLLMSTYHLTETNMASYIAKINSFRPDLIDGYPSAVTALARYVVKSGKKVHQPVAIATTAETLYQEQRDIIEEAFGCRVYNQYASSEGGPFITECPHGNLHINTDSGFFEFEPIAAGATLCELVVTSYRQWKTPLIRYKTGDIVDIGSHDPYQYKQCACGSCMPQIHQIIGREDDVLYTYDKGYVGRMDTAYKGLSSIIRSQIIQHSPEHIEVLVVPEPTYSVSMEAKLLQNLKDRLGSSPKIIIKTVNTIPLSANGKFKAVVRKFELP